MKQSTRKSAEATAPKPLLCLSALRLITAFPASDSAASGRPSGRWDRLYILLTSGIQIRLTKPFAQFAAAEADFAGGTNQGCLKLRQIIKAELDHRNARTPPPFLPKVSQGGVRRLQSQSAMVAKMVLMDFVRALPWRGAFDASNTAGKRRIRAGSSRANQLVRQDPGLGSKGSAR